MVRRTQMARTCHTAASLRPSRSSSLVEGARASLRLGAVLQRALPPVRPVASTTASIEVPRYSAGVQLDQLRAVLAYARENGYSLSDPGVHHTPSA